MKRYLDSTLSPEERAEDLLSQMSLEEKMGQVRCLFPFGGSDGDLDKNAAHGIGEVSTLDLREFTCLEDVVAWQRSLQTRIMGHSEHHIPAIFHMEGLCGAFLPGATAFPSGIARGAGFDPELENKIGRTVARQELSCGINRILAPVLDVARDSRLGRYGESYGEDPTLVASLGAAYTKGVQMAEVEGRRAESMAKHFVGFHASAAGIHGAHSEVPERPLREIFGKPFQASISVSSLRGVMPCYCSINGEALSASKHYLTEMLREEMGFDGVVGSDYGALGNLYEVQA